MDDQDDKLEGLYYRTKHQAEAGGVKLEDTMICIFGWKGEGEITIGEFKQFMSTSGQFGDFFCEDPSPSYSYIDVTGRNVSTIDGVNAVIGLKWSGEDSYGQILDKIDENRVNEKELNEISSKDTKKSKKDREYDDLETCPMAKTRSSLKRILSFGSSGEKTSPRSGGGKTRTRRHSLI
jgi:hypothetical protein